MLVENDGRTRNLLTPAHPLLPGPTLQTPPPLLTKPHIALSTNQRSVNVVSTNQRSVNVVSTNQESVYLLTLQSTHWARRICSRRTIKYSSFRCSQWGTSLSINQLENSVVICWPIREQCCYLLTNQRLAWFYVNQSDDWSIYLRNTFGWIFRIHNKPSAADTLESSRRVDTILLTNGRLQTALINIFADVLIAGYLEITIATRTLIRSLRVTSVTVSHVLERTAAYNLPDCCCTLQQKGKPPR